MGAIFSFNTRSPGHALQTLPSVRCKNRRFLVLFRGKPRNACAPDLSTPTEHSREHNRRCFKRLVRKPCEESSSPRAFANTVQTPTPASAPGVALRPISSARLQAVHRANNVAVSETCRWTI